MVTIEVGVTRSKKGPRKNSARDQIGARLGLAMIGGLVSRSKEVEQGRAAVRMIVRLVEA